MVDNIDDVSVENSNSISMIRHKIVFIGDVAVGKTSILNRYKGKSLKLQIWDSAGQERYRSLIPTYVRGASLIFLVYDMSKRETFDSIPNWINFIKGIENPIIVLIGNKKVDYVEAEKLADKEGLLFFEISAKTNENIKKAFYSSIAELPFFEQITPGNKQKLINELGNLKRFISILNILELENDDKKFDTKILTDIPNNKLNINGDLKEPKIKKDNQCKC